MIGGAWSRSALVATWLFTCGCTEVSSVGAQTVSDAGAQTVAAQTKTPNAAAQSAQAPGPAPAPNTRAPIELLGLTITSGVEKKEPVDKLKQATAGTRVYAHLKVRNRSNEKRTLHVDFVINGKLRTPLKLDVEPSWSFRTWGYNTLQVSDTGELEIQVFDDAGTTLETVRLPIVAK